MNKMKNIVICLFCGILFSCKNEEKSDNTGAAGNPAVTQPPSENIPDSMKINADSTIVPDSSKIDSLRR
jgi:hypothetical protein